MAIWLARYHGGISFSLAVSLTFLALIVHQRAMHRTSPSAELNTSLVEQVEPAAEPSHAPNVYAEKWRAMANEYYAKHPLPEDSSSQQVASARPTPSSHNESNPSPETSSSVQLASHQQSASQHGDAHRSVADQPADRAAVPATTLQVVDAEILPTRSVIAAIADLGIGGLFAGLSAAGIAFIFFHTACLSKANHEAQAVPIQPTSPRSVLVQQLAKPPTSVSYESSFHRPGCKHLARLAKHCGLSPWPHPTSPSSVRSLASLWLKRFHCLDD